MSIYEKVDLEDNINEDDQINEQGIISGGYNFPTTRFLPMTQDFIGVKGVTEQQVEIDEDMLRTLREPINYTTEDEIVVKNKKKKLRDLLRE